MKKVIISLSCILCSLSLMGKTVEYNLPAEDNNTGQFYLGKFLIGTYEITCNVRGIHANYTGWKVIIGSNWAGSHFKFTELFNNIPGKIVYQKEDNAYFHLWWDAQYRNGGQQWTPHIRVEYQAGNCIHDAPEPERSSSKVLTSTFNADRIYLQDLLDVKGLIKAEEIRVEANGNTADFVFNDNYQLRQLTEVEYFIKTNRHLPDIPSAAEMEASGVNLAEMNKLLLQKVEELTLYSIEQEKEGKSQKEKVKRLEGEVLSLEERLTKMEALLQKMLSK